MNTKLIAALKEVARLVIFSIPGILITVLTSDPTIAGSFGVPILMVLRAIDKAIHEDKGTASKGLLPF